MNVKADKVLMELNEVEEIFVFPSCGDEANAIGACYRVEAKINGVKNLAPLKDIYFGIEFSNDEIKQRFENYMNQKGYFTSAPWSHIDYLWEIRENKLFLKKILINFSLKGCKWQDITKKFQIKMKFLQIGLIKN